MILPALRIAISVLLMVAHLAAVEGSFAPGPSNPHESGALLHQLAMALPPVPEIVMDGSSVVWRCPGCSVPIVGVDPTNDDFLVETDRGRLCLSKYHVIHHHTELLVALPQLIANAKAASIDVNGFRLTVNTLTGPTISDREHVMVVLDGVLRRQLGPPSDRLAEIAQLSRSRSALDAAVPGCGLDAVACESMVGIINRIDGRERYDRSPRGQEIAASFARRLVGHGFLRHWFTDAAGRSLVSTSEQAVAEAVRPMPVRIFAAADRSYQELRDAFGNPAWTYTRGNRTSYLMFEPRPSWFGIDMPPLTVVVDLRPGADPYTPGDQISSAESYDGQWQLVAGWSPAKGFSSRASWPAVDAGVSVMEGAIPPHILMRSLTGDVLALAVDKGLLHPVADRSPAAAETFLGEAARLLPDAEHLDLIGEYLFDYAYPSPEAKQPELIGQRRIAGNFQRTAVQTCGTTAGGVMHGDCVDIAELYQQVLQRQGKLPLLIGLPTHAACCWAEEAQDDQWIVNLIQTGPPLRFSDATLPITLGKAYRFFDPNLAFDANQVPILLRFSDENSRSDWYLSWRIFNEPTYCRTMIEVQRDWHFATYKHGIVAMTQRIDSGDDDVANYIELCGLYTKTGQYDLAEEACVKACAISDTSVSKVKLSIRSVGLLMAAGHDQAAVDAASDVINRQLPEIDKGGDDSIRRLWMSLASTCLAHESPAAIALARAIITTHLVSPMRAQIDAIGQWMNGVGVVGDHFQDDKKLRSAQADAKQYCLLGTTLLTRLGSVGPTDTDLGPLVASIDSYLAHIAFHDLNTASELMRVYAMLGHAYQITVGKEAFFAMLQAVAPARQRLDNHAARPSASEQLTRDLPWIRASVPFWYGQLSDLFGREHDQLDVTTVTLIMRYLKEAVTASTALGLTDPDQIDDQILADELAALVAKDPIALRTVLHVIVQSADKSLLDRATAWLGTSARFMDAAWFSQVLAAWREEIDAKPSYLHIAWTACTWKAPVQALLAASVAAARFPDDPAVTDEYAYMRTILSAARTRQSP